MWDYNRILEKYIAWIKDNTKIKAIGDGLFCEISTPFLDRRNDHINIYIKKADDNYLLTDDGYFIEDLKYSGLELTSPKRKKIFDTILQSYGVQVKNDQFVVEATESNIAQKKHYLLQAILQINDMFMLSQESVFSLFKEDVELYLSSRDIRYSKDVKLTGKSGYDHNIDFLFSASKSSPEILMKTINNPTKEAATSAIFTFNDINEFRDTPTRNFLVYNDLNNQASADVLRAMQVYKIEARPWSRKEELAAVLA